MLQGDAPSGSPSSAPREAEDAPTDSETSNVAEDDKSDAEPTKETPSKETPSKEALSQETTKETTEAPSETSEPKGDPPVLSAEPVDNSPLPGVPSLLPSPAAPAAPSPAALLLLLPLTLPHFLDRVLSQAYCFGTLISVLTRFLVATISPFARHCV